MLHDVLFGALFQLDSSMLRSWFFVPSVLLSANVCVVESCAASSLTLPDCMCVCLCVDFSILCIHYHFFDCAAGSVILISFYCDRYAFVRCCLPFTHLFQPNTSSIVWFLLGQSFCMCVYLCMLVCHDRYSGICVYNGYGTSGTVFALLIVAASLAVLLFASLRLKI